MQSPVRCAWELFGGRMQRCHWGLIHISSFCAQLHAAFSGGSRSVCLSCSGVGVCTDNHNCGGDDGDGGGDHVSAEPLQTLCAILHQPAQPGETEGREPLISKSCPAFQPASSCAGCQMMWHWGRIRAKGIHVGPVCPCATWHCMKRHCPGWILASSSVSVTGGKLLWVPLGLYVVMYGQL